MIVRSFATLSVSKMARFNPGQLAEWTDGTWLNGVPPVIDGVSTDSRKISPGNIFIAIRGPNFDGHNFVSAAVNRGACGAVVMRGYQAADRTCPCLVVDDTAKALQHMAAGYRRTPNAKIIAVTGSVGKTTVKEMIARIFACRMETAKTIGNLNNEYGLPLSILNMDPKSRVGVFELGVNHPGEMAPLCRLLNPDYGVITAVGPVHLEFFGSEKAVAEEKSVLLKFLPADGIAFLGRDQPWFEFMLSAVKCRVVSLGAHKEADYSLIKSENKGEVAEVLEKKSGRIFSFRVPLPGSHVVYDCLFAVAVARTCGLEWNIIREALENFQAQPMRWESKTMFDIRVINDAYNANPVSMQAALQTFANMSHSGGKWLVLAGMHELGSYTGEAHEKIGAFLAQYQWAGLITVGSYGKIIAAAALKAGMDNDRVHKCENHCSAVEIISALVKPGDAVLLKASRCEKLEKVLEIWMQLKTETGAAALGIDFRQGKI